MARIRSVHPGLFTDEAFMALSDAAQVFLIGLWTEADDQGVFEWKPLTLRARLRPAKDGDVTPLLEEIEAVNCIARYEIGDRQYGVIRNFRKYQRPKSPNAVHPIPDNFRNYVALSPPTSEIADDEPPPVSPKRGNPSAEGGGRRKEKEEGNKRPPSEGARAPSVASPDKELFDLGKQVLGANAGGLITRLKNHAGIEGAMGHLREAAGKSDAREWIGAVLRDPEAKADADYDAWRDDYLSGVM